LANLLRYNPCFALPKRSAIRASSEGKQTRSNLLARVDGGRRVQSLCDWLKRGTLLPLAGKVPSRNSLHKLTCSFAGWRRCSLVADPCGYAPRSRLASRQNPCAIL